MSQLSTTLLIVGGAGVVIGMAIGTDHPSGFLNYIIGFGNVALGLLLETMQ